MITVPKLLILLAIIVVIFGTKRLRSIGTDLGESIKNFRTALKEGEGEKTVEAEKPAIEGDTAKPDDKA
ncbi:Sec-independent protein translocase protein TatA [uncultured bacterium]|nr:Sec-independent protein translocase protein TatA [uncultured bacterium]